MDDAGLTAVVEHYRPNPDLVMGEWSRADRDLTLTTILTGTPGHRGHRRRWVVGALAAGTAAAVTLGLLLPGGAPGGPTPAAAATLERLAVIAGSAGPAVAPEQYAYVAQNAMETVQPGTPLIPGYLRAGGLDHSSSRTWTSPGGTVWIYRAQGRPIACLQEVPFAASGYSPDEDGSYEDLSAAALAALPTEPHALAGFFDDHPSGDNRGARNRFIAVGDLVRSGLASPQLRAAAIRVLADTDGVEVNPTAVDATGRPAIRVDEPSAHSVLDSLFFDPRTSELIEEQTTQGHWLYRSVITETGVVDAIPSGLPRC